MILKPLKIMPVLNESSFTKAPFPTQKFEEARCGVGERIRYPSRNQPTIFSDESEN